MKALAILTCFFSCATFLYGSADVEIDPSSVSWSISSMPLEVKMEKGKDGGLSSFSVVFHGKKFVVPQEELEGCGKGFRLSKVRVLVSDAKVKNSELTHFGIVVSCGEPTVNDVGQTSIIAFDEVSFLFDGGELLQRNRAVSEGDGKSSWQIYSKLPGQKENATEKHSGPRNPLNDE